MTLGPVLASGYVLLAVASVTLEPVLASGCILLAVVSATVDEKPPEDSIPMDYARC